MSTTPRWLRAGRIVWIALALFFAATWVVSLPVFYQRVSTLTISEPYVLGERIVIDNAIAQRAAEARGLSQSASAAYDVIKSVIYVVVFLAIAAVVLAKAPSGMGWFTALVLMLMGVIEMTGVVGVAQPFPGAVFLIVMPGYLVWPLWIWWLFVFPSGRFVPLRGHRIVELLLVAFMAWALASFWSAFSALPNQFNTVGAQVLPIVILPLCGYLVFAQAYRYVRVSSVMERQQTKWFLSAISVWTAGLLAWVLNRSVFGDSLIANDFSSLVGLVIPISVTIAILRYRLWNIDVIIRRTLVYGLLSALLAGIYFGSVALLQTVITALTGQARSELVTVVSTLAIAGLVLPLRNALQMVIDRRFYRRKFNAEQALARFSAEMRDAVEMEAISTRLMDLVEETMQPERVSVWVTGFGRKQPTVAQVGD
ncbi:MAG: hypothetical protein ABIQ99_14225 [Thermoflexales bacterium]